ncbi:MAG TPA: N-acetyl-gamma-glutamyl-phosphate reductase [Acidimicrobiales bacterium]
MKAAVIGASGYLGAELLRLLSTHPEIDVAVAQADSTAGSRPGDLYAGLSPSYADLVLSTIDPTEAIGCDVAFVAVPSGHSQAIVASLVNKVGLIVDLGADFRLKDPAAYEQWYHFTHQQPELLADAVFGLPELFRDQIAGATLIASPGCYVTAASLALAPLVKAGIIENHGIIVDAASGTSGAGKEPRPDLHFAKVNESFSAYGLLDHRHTPEIEQTIGAQILFTPHLAPMTRGILATIYAKPTGATSTEALLDALRSAYDGEPFIEVGGQAPSTRDTYGSNLVRMTARYDERTNTVLLLSALDNLTKGGSGQALQSTNIALGLPETLGLPRVALLP